MKINIEDATELADRALQKLGYSEADTAKISHHLIDSELRGYGIAGLARILSIADHLGGKKPPSEITVTRDAPATAQLDGGDTLGYLVAHRATELAIEKAKQSGVAVVGANNTYYTGMLSYYAEMAAANDLVTVIASNCTPWVAPEGTYKPLLGTNPFCIGIPSSSTPIIYDIGTSKIIHAQVMLARRLGEDLPEGVAYNASGELTVKPEEVLEGALAVWGGAKGTGLAVSVQLLGVLAGSPALPPNLKDFGYLVMVINPAMFRPMEEFKAEVDSLVDAFHAAPTLPGKGDKLRLPFERSNKVREQARASGSFEVETRVVEKLKELVGS